MLVEGIKNSEGEVVGLNINKSFEISAEVFEKLSKEVVESVQNHTLDSNSKDSPTFEVFSTNMYSVEDSNGRECRFFYFEKNCIDENISDLVNKLVSGKRLVIALAFLCFCIFCFKEVHMHPMDASIYASNADFLPFDVDFGWYGVVAIISGLTALLWEFVVYGIKTFLNKQSDKKNKSQGDTSFFECKDSDGNVSHYDLPEKDSLNLLVMLRARFDYKRVLKTREIFTM